MKSISYFQYKLQLKNREAKLGALLKVEFAEGFGYADLFPWPEFGDSELDQQIDFLKRGKRTAILERSLQMAEIDCKLRAENKNAFDGISLKNHYLIRDISELEAKKLSELPALGYSSIKVKINLDFEKQLLILNQKLQDNELKIRLDFNSCLNWAQFELFAKSVPFELRHRIEFIEDPMPWNQTLWKKAAQFFPLAVDFETAKVPWASLAEVPMKYLILKPARLDPQQTLERALEFDCKIVVTNSFDHSVGVAHAAKVAADIQKTNPQILGDSGLISKIYEGDEFLNQLITDGAFFKGVPGIGIGFDKQFESTPWLKIIS